MPISFSEIPNSIRVPFAYVEFDKSKAQSGPSVQKYKLLLIGEMGEEGEYEGPAPVRIGSVSDAERQFGSGSMLHQMFEVAFKANSMTEMWGIPIQSAGEEPTKQVLEALGDEQYHVIAFPYDDEESLKALHQDLSQRFEALRQIEGFAFVCSAKTGNDLIQLGESINSPHISILECAHSETLAYLWAASLAAVSAFHLASDPARPLQTLALPMVKAAPIGSRVSFYDREKLLHSGISTHLVDAGGIPRIERLITTYRKNVMGVEDTSFLNVNTLFTLSYLRYDFRNYFSNKYPRHKLSKGGARPVKAQNVMTPAPFTDFKFIFT